MAGRGTDISLHPVVQAQEGLTVIVTEFHESARIDRQLVGRCARQGDPGVYIVIVAMTDQLFRNHGGWLYRWLIEQQQHLNHAIQDWQLALLKNYAQHRAERLNAKIRMETLRQDRQFDQTLAFAGNQI
jgi:preprotein translocase subunit SecA